jgi:hypothetical protein
MRYPVGSTFRDYGFIPANLENEPDILKHAGIESIKALGKRIFLLGSLLRDSLPLELCIPNKSPMPGMRRFWPF